MLLFSITQLIWIIIYIIIKMNSLCLIKLELFGFNLYPLRCHIKYFWYIVTTMGVIFIICLIPIFLPTFITKLKLKLFILIYILICIFKLRISTIILIIIIIGFFCRGSKVCLSVFNYFFNIVFIFSFFWILLMVMSYYWFS